MRLFDTLMRPVFARRAHMSMGLTVCIYLQRAVVYDAEAMETAKLRINLRYGQRTYRQRRDAAQTRRDSEICCKLMIQRSRTFVKKEPKSVTIDD